MGYADPLDERARKSRREWYYRNRPHAIEMTKEYKEKHKTKVCAACKEEKPADQFKTKVQNGKRYLRFECKRCQGKRDGASPYGKAYSASRKETVAGKARASRLDPEQRPVWILRDARTLDRKFGRRFNLTVEVVRDLIANGCLYCGASECMMTLDRIDNQLGHAIGNVNPSCFRCNYLRRDMPYEAWMVVVEGVREAQSRGLFGNWMIESFHQQSKKKILIESEADGKPAHC